MDFILLALATLVLILMLMILTVVYRLKQRATTLQTQLGGSRLQLPDDERPVISLEILNPFEVAQQESNLAGPVIAVAPEIIRRIVYRRTSGILREQLKERGVQAQVRVHHVD